MLKAVSLSLVTCVLATSSATYAQTLGEVARRAEERRKTQSSTGKVYTGDTLRPEPAPSSVPPPVTATPVPSSDAAKSGDAAAKSADAAAKPGAAKEAEEPKRDQAYWRDLMKNEREAVDRAQMFAEALQSRINGLSADYVSRDDPAQRAQIGAERQKAMAELSRVQKEISEGRKAIADTEENARRAGVPAGWLR